MAVAALAQDVTESGMNQGDLVKAIENLHLVVNEIQDDHATYKTVVDDLKVLVNRHRTQELTRCVTPPNFEIDTNYDIQNGDAFEIEVAGVQKTVATDVNFDTGTATVIATNAYWAGVVLSVDVDGTTAYCDWGAEDVAEAGAITNLAAVTASGGVVVGYATVHAKGGQDFVAGTDALTTGTGGQVAQATNYYNDQHIGDGAMGAAVSTSSPAALTNGTNLKLTAG